VNKINDAQRGKRRGREGEEDLGEGRREPRNTKKKVKKEEEKHGREETNKKEKRGRGLGSRIEKKAKVSQFINAAV
jgi:predicted RecB family nuclease